MIAFSWMCRENATMVERGLIQAADAVEVVTGQQQTKSRYVPLVLPKSGDVTKTLAVFYVEEPPNGNGFAPSEYMMVLGAGEVRIDLEGVSSSGVVEVRVSYEAGQLAALIEKVDRMGDVRSTAHADNSVGQCQDLVVGYKLYAKSGGGRWVEYLHGPLTFQCNQAVDEHDKSMVRPSKPGTSSPSGGTGRTGQGHNFDHGIGGGPGGFDGSFLSDDAVTASGDKKSAIIEVDADDTRSQYAELIVERCDDIRQVIAHVTSPTVAPRPEQFMLLLGEDTIGVTGRRLVLELDNSDVIWDISLEILDEIVAELLADPTVDAKTDSRDYPDECLDVEIQYTFFGRPLTEEWREYAHGPLVLQCCADARSSSTPGRGRIRPSRMPKSVIDGPFMTKSGFNPAFMSVEGEEGS